MIAEGQIVLFRFSQTDQQTGKLRSALIIRKLPGQYMISSQHSQEIPAFDEIITSDDPDFRDSGLKLSSLVRIGRLAVVNRDILIGHRKDRPDRRSAPLENKAKIIQMDTSRITHQARYMCSLSSLGS